MSINDGVITKYIEQKLDSDGTPIKELITKLFVRIHVFLACVFIPPVLAIILTGLVPPDFEATTQVLIRYTGTESAFFGDLITEGRSPVSGASSAQMMKSIPVIARTIQQKRVEEKDVYKDVTKVLGGYVGAFVERFLPTAEESSQIATNNLYPGIDRPTLLLAGTWQEDAIEVETTEKPSGSMPIMNSGDELITVTVTAFNREKLAEMTNGIVESFIEEYYKRSAEEAQQAYQYLNVLVEKTELSVASLQKQQASGSIMEADASTDTLPPVSNKRDRSLDSNPRLESTAQELASLERELVKRRQTFREDARDVVKVKNRINEINKVLAFEERLEMAKDMLGDLKKRRQQAALTQSLYENRLVPISIVEPAFIPKKSPFKLAARYLIAGGAGLALGIIFGLGLVITLNLMDRRVYTSWDLKKMARAPVLGALPSLPKVLNKPVDVNALPLPAWEGDIQRVLGRFESLSPNANLITLTSATEADANSFVALQMACSLAKDRNNKILLIDGNFSQPVLNDWFGKDASPGLLEVLVQGTALEQALKSTELPNLMYLPTGDTALRSRLGFCRNSLQAMLSSAQEQGFNFVLIDAQSLLTSREALLFSLSTQAVILNARAMATRREVVEEAITRLEEVGGRLVGTILNNKLHILPNLVYRWL